MYDQYKQYIGRSDPPNRFFRLPAGETEEAEDRLGYRFPNQLRDFFSEIGYGFLKQGLQDKAVDRFLINRVIPPSEIADLVCGGANDLLPDGGLLNGEMPFFDLGDRVYLILTPQSENPQRVMWLDGQVLTESVVEFFDRLFEKAGFFKEP